MLYGLQHRRRRLSRSRCGGLCTRIASFLHRVSRHFVLSQRTVRDCSPDWRYMQYAVAERPEVEGGTIMRSVVGERHAEESSMVDDRR